MFNEACAYAFFGLAMVPITVYFNQFLFFVFAFYVSMRKFYKKQHEPPEFLPGVSILKPLMGLDPLLRENIVSHMELCYPTFEIIFCVEDPNDPVVELVQSLFHEYPNVDARIIIGGNGNVINPMVNNMLPGYESAKYDLVWVSTSRIKANTDILLDMVRKSEDPGVALVHQLPYYSDQKGFMNAIEKVCFGCALGRSSMALNHMGMLCFTGMSYIVRKSTLDKFGGLARFGKFLAEDFFFSKELFDNGYKIVLSAYPAQQNVANGNLQIYVGRMVRWLRLRLNMLTIVATFFEPMIECINLGIIISFSLKYFFGFPVLTTFAIHVSVWILLDYLLLRSVQGGPLPFSFLTFFLAWWTRELLTYVIYVKAILQPRTIKWGVNTFRLSLGGHTELYRTPKTGVGIGGASRGAGSSKSGGICNGGPGLAKGNADMVNGLEKIKVKVEDGVSKAGLISPVQAWGSFAHNGYIRGSMQQQHHLVLISDT